MHGAAHELAAEVRAEAEKFAAEETEHPNTPPPPPPLSPPNPPSSSYPRISSSSEWKRVDVKTCALFAGAERELEPSQWDRRAVSPSSEETRAKLGRNTG